MLKSAVCVGPRHAFDCTAITAELSQRSGNTGTVRDQELGWRYVCFFPCPFFYQDQDSLDSIHYIHIGRNPRPLVLSIRSMHDSSRCHGRTNPLPGQERRVRKRRTVQVLTLAAVSPSETACVLVVALAGGFESR
jgi:hypothetical protein